MKIKSLLMTAAVAGLSFSGYAQDDEKQLCMEKVSLLTNYVKQGNFADAMTFFDEAYSKCPSIHSSLYTQGEKTFVGLLKAETDQAKKDALLDKFMGVYDSWIKYYGNQKKTPKYFLLGRKANNYVKYSDEKNPDVKLKAYDWYAEALKLGGENCDVMSFWNFMDLSVAKFKKDPAHKEQLIEDYLYIAPLMVKRSNSGVPKDTIFAEFKGEVDMAFARSGVADCKTLDGIYASKLDASKDDKVFLERVLSLYAMADCEESAVYFKASDFMHKINPSAGSALGMAAQALKNKDYSKAINYYKEALKLTDDRALKSKTQVAIASVYYKLGNYAECRNFSNAALASNAKNSYAYQMMASAFVAGRAQISDDAIIQKTAFWIAVDKLEKAKQIDPGCAASVNKLISNYKAQFPSKSEMFMRGVSGATYKVPGWINETTTVR